MQDARDMGSTDDGKRLQINLDMFDSARQDHSGLATWFLDLETGQVRMFFDGMLDGDRVEDEFDIDAYLDSGSFRVIRSAFSSDGYRLMEQFIETLPSGHANSVLFEAIQGRKPFRRFKDVLFDLGAVRDDWFKFEAAGRKADAERWLEDEEIEADLV